MKSKEQIINDSIKLETPPEDYNLLEIHCFLALKQLMIMFQNKQMSKENATKSKNKILSKYESDSKQYEFERNMFQEHIEHLKTTEMKRTKLRKMLYGEEEESKPVTEERLCETINLCVDILNTVFKGEFV